MTPSRQTERKGISPPNGLVEYEDIAAQKMCNLLQFLAFTTKMLLVTAVSL